VFQAEFAGQGSAVLNDFSGAIDLAGGWLTETDGGRDVTTHLREAGEFTLEIVLLPAEKQPADRTTIVSLAGDGEQANLELAQEKDEFVFKVQTDGEVSKQLLRIPVIAAKRPVHLTITCAHGELLAYRDGEKVDRKEVSGSLAEWNSGPLAIGGDVQGNSPWHGAIEALAIHHRRLDAGEVARNVQNYRTLARRP
jgi:hypothetical protein